MKARERLQAARAALDSLEAQEEALRKQKREVGTEAGRAFRDLLVEEKLLGQKVWVLDVRDAHDCYLECEARSRDWSELSDFAETSYHCSYLLEGTEGGNDDAEIVFDDGRIIINLRNPDHLQALVDRYGMMVRLTEHLASKKQTLLDTLKLIGTWEQVLRRDA
jgi:hypothetical protein